MLYNMGYWYILCIYIKRWHKMKQILKIMFNNNIARSILWTCRPSIFGKELVAEYLNSAVKRSEQKILAHDAKSDFWQKSGFL